jgi:hypothetical protein
MAKAKLKVSVDEIIEGLPKAEQLIVKRLRAIILECLPKAEEKKSYGVPFYRRNRMICYIWPSSIQWEPTKKKKDPEKLVVLGFCQGNLMSNEDHVLLAEGRKQVYCMYFKSLPQINEPQIRALLFEAGMIDESFKKIKKKQ